MEPGPDSKVTIQAAPRDVAPAGLSKCGKGRAVVVILDTRGAEGANAAIVGSVSSRGPGGLGGTAEVGAVVPGGAGEATVGRSLRDGGGGPLRGEEILEMRDVLELQ